jgi:hypothetical protein
LFAFLPENKKSSVDILSFGIWTIIVFIAFFVWIICTVRTAVLNSLKYDFPGKFLGFGFMAQAWE